MQVRSLAVQQTIDTTFGGLSGNPEFAEGLPKNAGLHSKS